MNMNIKHEYDFKISKDLKTIRYTVLDLETGKTEKIEKLNKWKREDIEWNLCPECHNHLVRMSRYKPAVKHINEDWVPAQVQAFIGCSNFPNCKYSKSIVRDVEEGEYCEDEGPYYPYYPDDLY